MVRVTRVVRALGRQAVGEVGGCQGVWSWFRGAKWSGGGSIAAKSNGGYDPLKGNGAEVHGGRGAGAARGCDMAPSSVFA